MKGQRQKRSISGIAALLLFGVFALGVLSVLLTGADAYRRLTERDRLRYDGRTCARYVVTKLRQAAAPDAVAVAGFGDGDALLLTEDVDGTAYQTSIYCHDGWLMELFSAADAALEPEDGEKILQVESLEISLEDGLLRVHIVDANARPITLRVSLRGGEGAAA